MLTITLNTIILHLQGLNWLPVKRIIIYIWENSRMNMSIHAHKIWTVRSALDLIGCFRFVGKNYMRSDVIGRVVLVVDQASITQGSEVVWCRALFVTLN